MFKQRLQVIGIKFFNDKVEGVHYDHTKLVVLMPVPADSKTQKGYGAVELPCGKSEEAKRFDGVNFPCYVECEIALTNKGYEVSNIADLKVVGSVSQAQATGDKKAA